HVPVILFSIHRGTCISDFNPARRPSPSTDLGCFQILECDCCNRCLWVRRGGRSNCSLDIQRSLSSCVCCAVVALLDPHWPERLAFQGGRREEPYGMANKVRCRAWGR